MSNAMETVNRYYGVWERNGKGMEDVLADDFSFVGPMEQLDRQGMVAAAEKMGPAFGNFQMKKQFQHGDEVCSIYDMDITTPGGVLTFSMAEWVRTSGGKVSQARLFFDPRKLMEAGA